MQKEPTPEDLLVSIAKILKNLKIPYYVTGGFAVSVWGRPRFTADIDLIIKMTHHEKSDFVKEIKKLSPKGYLDNEQIDTALSREGEFNFIDPDTGMKVDFWIIKDEMYEKECLQRIIPQDFGYKVNFISPEDLIISKLIWYKKSQSTRHLEDIKSILKITKVDNEYISRWVKKLKLAEEYKKAKNLNGK